MEKGKDPTDKSGEERNKKGNRVFKLSKTKFSKRIKHFSCILQLLLYKLPKPKTLIFLLKTNAL